MKTVLCIPGNWANRGEFVRSVVENNLNEFIFAGQILLNIKTQVSFEVEFCERDKAMRDAFDTAGKTMKLSDAFLDEIQKHTFVIYLIGETGSLAKAQELAEAGLAILNAGGIGVKVENAGKAFTADHWRALLKDYDEPYLYQMFVVDSILAENGTVFSCGMHNLGFKDTIVSGETFQDAADLIRIFGNYQIVDKPTIIDKQTFRSSADSPRFEIVEEENQPYKDEELFDNPFGMWRLRRITEN